MNLNYLEVIKVKGLASFQDLGRPKAQHLGFSASGAADEYNFLLANLLIGNPLNSPAIEITFGQFSVKAITSCSIVLTGADCGAAINDININNYQIYQLKAGDLLSLSIPKKMLHTYLSIKGGFITPLFKGSCAYSANEKSLAVFKSAIAQGNQLNFPSADNNNYRSQGLSGSFSPQEKTLIKNSTLFHQADHDNYPLVLRFIPSIFWRNLSHSQQKKIQDESYTIQANSNRMGYRLSAKLKIVETFTSSQMQQYQQLSKPVNYGAIQLPEDSQPIILMKDRQTIGGYPVLGCVIQTDLFRLSQKRPGEKVMFIPTTVTVAQQQLSHFYRRFKSDLEGIT